MENTTCNYCGTTFASTEQARECERRRTAEEKFVLGIYLGEYRLLCSRIILRGGVHIPEYLLHVMGEKTHWELQTQLEAKLLKKEPPTIKYDNYCRFKGQRLHIVVFRDYEYEWRTHITISLEQDRRSTEDWRLIQTYEIISLVTTHEIAYNLDMMRVDSILLTMGLNHLIHVNTLEVKGDRGPILIRRN